MNPASVTQFLTNYIHSLKERTRKEATGTPTGIDNLFYSLGIARKWKPQRLPFIRQGADKTAKSKTEGEFGVDVSFTNDNDTELIIFVLKDEALTYKNFTAENFDSDLRRAVAYDIDRPELQSVKFVRIILGYNKDEDEAGIRSFNGLVKNFPATMGNNVPLAFERWNLSEITSQVEQYLLSPSLLPQRFFGRLTYICSQVGDFSYASEEWSNQLVPNWRGFLSELLVLRDVEDLQRVAIALLIIRVHGRQHSNFETAWIDLLEWATLALWSSYLENPSQRALEIVKEVWSQMYLVELDRFYSAHRSALATEHSIDSIALGSHMAPYAANAIAFWHLGRLGIFSIACHELQISLPPEAKPFAREHLILAADTILDLLDAQSSATYPLLDIQHIELFLTWRALWTAGYDDRISEWLTLIVHRLGIRMEGKSAISHILPSGWPLLLDEVGRNLSQEINGQSSYLLLMLVELSCCLPESQRKGICQFIVTRVAKSREKKTPSTDIHLTLWTPEKDWSKKILKDRATAGVEIAADFDSSPESIPVADQIQGFVDATRARYPTEAPPIYRSVLALACMKHQSPLPAEFWRAILFPMQTSTAHPAETAE